jgi:hypothetical protein
MRHRNLYSPPFGTENFLSHSFAISTAGTGAKSQDNRHQLLH